MRWSLDGRDGGLIRCSMHQSQKNITLKPSGSVTATLTVFNVLIYFGSKTSYSPDLDPASQQAVKVFDTLLKPCGKGHHIYADRYYTSFPLLQYLHERSYYYTGTLNINRRDFPKAIKTTKLIYLQMKWFMHVENKFLCVMFRNKKAKKPCILVSSEASVATVQKTSRTGEVRGKPSLVESYNFSMNGCDKVDQCVTTYGTFQRRTRKWWKKIFFWIFEVAQLNAFILHALTRPGNTPKKPLLHFKTQLIHELSLVFHDEHHISRLQINNHIIRKSLLITRQCVICSTAEKSTRTSFFCQRCTNHPFLHPNKCFSKYHSK
uniref:PiggyBac transposable element-derived protein domain-containing protein n=1 Tax=Arion vulgaris TaxID=1028688 RepID=A0A0B7BGN1_9EUPU